MEEEKFTLGLIAARGGSKGIPDKNLLKIGGKELVRIAVEVGLEVPGIDKLVCTTDSEKIANVAEDAGAEVPFIRPRELALDCTPMLPVIEHSIDEMEKREGRLVGRIVLLDPTAPMRSAQDVEDTLAYYNESDCDLVVSVHQGHHNPYFNMLESEGMYFKLPKGADANYGARQAAPAVYQINTVAWVYSRRSIKIERKRIPKKTLIYEFPETRSIDLDTPDDISKLNYFLQSSTGVG